MNVIIAIPLGLRLALLFAAGAVVGCALNAFIYAVERRPRLVTPWSRRFPRDARSSWIDYLPIIGWQRLARHADCFGRGFWVRPMLVEAATGILFAALYWWEIDQRGLLRAALPVGPALLATLHAQYAAHLVLSCFLIVAALVDADETMIPDVITAPGTLLGIGLAALWPWSLLPADARWAAGGAVELDFLTLASPNAWPAALDAWPNPVSLALAIVCYLAWCAALLPRVWRPKRGFRRAVGLFFAFWARAGWCYPALALLGTTAIAVTWRFAAAPHWQGMLTALVGIVGGGALVWAIRAAASWQLRQEAMGFGDVTLLAMIGAFLGWQSALITFFLAPLAAVGFGLARWLMGRGKHLPFGPFLCPAALAVVVWWKPIWQVGRVYFAIPWLVPTALVVCLVLLVGMLAAWGALRERLSNS